MAEPDIIEERARRIASGTWSAEDEAGFQSIVQDYGPAAPAESGNEAARERRDRAAFKGKSDVDAYSNPSAVPYSVKFDPNVDTDPGNVYARESVTPVEFGDPNPSYWTSRSGQASGEKAADKELNPTIPMGPQPMTAGKPGKSGKGSITQGGTPGNFGGSFSTGGSGFSSVHEGIGMNLQAALKFLPDYLRPASEGYLPPGYEQDLQLALENGDISEDQYRKAQGIVDKYQQTSVLGTELEAQRAQQKVRDFNTQTEAKVLDEDAKFRQASAQKQLEMIDDLENSDLMFRAAEDYAKEEMDKQIETIKSRVRELDNLGQNSFGDAFQGVFNAIAAGLGAVGATLARTPNFAMEAINTQMNARMNKMALDANNKRAQISGEMNIYQILRDDLQNDRAAQHAAKLSLIQRAQLEIEAMAGNSASLQIRERAKAMIHGLGIQAQAEEAQLLAQITAQVQAKKMGFLSGSAGNLKKRKDQLVGMMQAPDGHIIEPMKGYAMIASRGPGIDLQGFAEEKYAAGITQQLDGVQQLEWAVSELEDLAAKTGFGTAVSGFWGQDKMRHDRAKSALLLGIRQLNTGIGALDKGVQEVAEPFAPDLEGPVDAVYAADNVKQARNWVGAMKKRIMDNAQPHIIPGREDVIMDSEGQGTVKWIVRPHGPGQEAQTMKSAQQQQDYTSVQFGEE